MFKPKKFLACFLVLISLCSGAVFALDGNLAKNPDYSKEFVGQDKFEKFNRKMFGLNTKLNKYALRPMHIIWASVMPKYGIDRIQGVYDNSLYPRKVVSNIIQGKFKSAGKETVRFLANTTLGLGGMFDPAKRYFKLESTNADMEQALAKCKVKSGPYIVCPIITATNPRALAGKILDLALDPSTYLGMPIISLIKLGFTFNKASYWQPLMTLLEADYADPYEVARKFYGVTNYLKNNNIAEKEVSGIVVDDILQDGADFDFLQNSLYKYGNSYNCLGKVLSDMTVYDEIKFQSSPDLTVNDDDIIAAKIELTPNTDCEKTEEKPPVPEIHPNIVLENFNPQNPVIDAMRTAFFDLPGVDDSMWSELSLWNRSFGRRLKTTSINLVPQRADYKFRYLMQKKENAPVVIIYPSIGEGYMSHHSAVLGKLFYDEGYSVIILGSHFQWEFVKSMPEGTIPGIPGRDVELVQMATGKIVNYLEDKYKTKFGDKVVIGTSFGAMMTLFLADREEKNKVVGVSKYIAVNPPIELFYAMNQFDKNTEEWKQSPDSLKNKAALVAEKVLNILNLEDVKREQKENLPFDEQEAKLITGFVMHQKLSDLIFTIENGSQFSNNEELYNKIHDMNYSDYVKKYLASEEYKDIDEFNNITSLHSISDYLKNNNNYRIYHSVDDYLVNSEQLLKLKEYCGDKVTIMSNGSHLGFLYRQEFINSLKDEITFKEKGRDNIEDEKHGLVSLAE